MLETDGEGVLILLLKGENVLNGGASEAIDTLIVVAHHADVAVRRGKQLYEHILGVVRVLILVHHYVFEFMLIKGQHIGALLEKPHRPHDYVVKIHGVGLFKLLLIELIGLCNGGKADVAGIFSFVFLGGDEHVLGLAYVGKQRLVGQHFVLNAKLLLALLHDPL